MDQCYQAACGAAGQPPAGYRLAHAGETVPYGCLYLFATAWYGTVEWKRGSKTTPFTIRDWHMCAIAVPMDGVPDRVPHEDD